MKFDLMINSLEVGDLSELISQLRPEWNQTEIKVKTFTEGISNATKAFYVNNLNSNDTMVIRMNGSGTDDFLDREQELEAYARLSAGNVCPPLIASFNNGLIMQMVSGSVFDKDTIKDETLAKITAHEIARMHKNVELLPNEREPALLAGTKKFIDLYPDKYSKVDVEKTRIALKLWSRNDLLSELETMKQLLEKQTTPLVVCHNDLLLANFLVDEKNEKVSIIDYEYLAPNPAAFDIANHFNEYAGTDEVDFTNVPDEEYQKWWLSQYLQEYLQTTTVSEAEISKWFKSVELMTPLSHLYWGAWAAMQAEISDIDFDYVTYAHLRLTEYFSLKNKLLSNISDLPQSR